MSTDNNRLWLVALNWDEATYYLSHLEPPLSPKSKRLAVLTTSSPNFVHKIHGTRWRDGDELVKYGNYYQGKYLYEILRMLDYIGAPVGAY